VARIVVSEFVSLDRAMEPRVSRRVTGTPDVLAHEALLLGRKTYEGFVAWKTRSPTR
jgi:hypothetical protein